MPMLFSAAIAATIAWGAFAFGAVYPWAYIPLLAACGLVGAWGLYVGRDSPAIARSRAFILPLIIVLVAALFQLLPLPGSVVNSISPAADAFLRSPDLGLGAGAILGWHPLSIKPAATMLTVIMLAAFGLFFLGSLKAFSQCSPLPVARALVVVGIALAVVGIGQKAMLGDDVWSGMRIYGFWKPRYSLVTPFGPYVNKNHYAGWMLMAIPLTLGLMGAAVGSATRYVRSDVRSWLLWLSTPPGGRFLLLGFSALLMTAAAFMTLSRSGIGSLMLTIPAMGALAARGHRARRVRAVVATALLVFVAAGAVWAGANETVTRLTAGSETLAFRVSIWRDVVRVFRDFPLTGTGLGTLGTATQLYQTSNQGVHFQEAHNDYLQLLAEGGFLLAIPIGIALVALVWTIGRRFDSDEGHPETYWLRVGAAGGLAAIALQSLVEFSLQMPGNTAMFALLLAFALHTRPQCKSV